ncbi:DNA polymerase III subunit alpha [Enterococcus sp. LJL98]
MSSPQLTTITAYSLLQSIVRIPAYVQGAKDMGYRQLAITDKGNLAGMLEFIEQCQKADVKPIIGLALEYQSIVNEQTYEVYLYAKNNQGLQQLMQLSSMKELQGKVSFESFPLSRDLFVLFPEKNELSALRQAVDDQNLAATCLQRWREKFNEAHLFYGVAYQGQLTQELRDWYESQQLKPCAYHLITALEAKDCFAVQVAKQIKAGTQIQDLRQTVHELEATNYLIEAPLFEKWFQDQGEEEALTQAAMLATACQVEVKLHQKLLPQYPLKEQNPAAFLRQLCFDSLPRRVEKVTAIYEERLNTELSIIHEMGFDDYFLIVWDVMAFAHNQKIVTGSGRGSAAGSLVAYVLSITDVDPIAYDLLFERFLNPERQTMPDIDLDFPDNRREEVIQYVKEKYGKEHVAQIGTFGTMAAKMVLRDVGRVFGVSQSEGNRWSSAVPKGLGVTLEMSYQQSKTFRDLVEANERNKKMFQVAQVLEGLPRHISTHAAGIVIVDQKLVDLVPLQAGQGDLWLTQFTMVDVEKIGLLKMDFLGLRNLSLIDDALQNISRLERKELHLKKVPLDDPQTIALFQKGETSGIFQFESAGIRKVLKKLNPETIEEIAAVNALYRPGPMQNIDEFVKRKKGLAPVQYLDPSLRPILENTYGIIVYEEQIMQIAQKMAGYRLGQADMLRRGISKKNAQILERERQGFIQGACAHGHTEKKANEVYNYIEKFANYGFNRSHAFAYSMVAFQMAYLKAHYPGPFYQALLQSTRNQPIKTKEYVHEAKKRQLKIMPPTINHSFYGFTLHTLKEIRFGLSNIKGLRRDFVQTILSERKENGPFTSFEQFLYRLNARESKLLKQENIQPLILVGAFDDFGVNRHQLLVQLEDKIQNILYSGGSMELLSMLELKEREVADYSLAERLAFEEEYLGVYLSGHPTRQFTKLLKRKKIDHLAEVSENQVVQLLFYVKSIKEIRTKKGELMAIVEGDDESQSSHLTLFPELYRQTRKQVTLNQVLYIEGRMQNNRYSNQLQVIPTKITPAAEVENSISEQTCYIKVVAEKNQPATFHTYRQLVQSFKGTVPVVFYYEETGKKVLLESEYWMSEDLRDKEALSVLFGEENVIFK